jgi:DME family drug/metabolite transporter
MLAQLIAISSAAFTAIFAILIRKGLTNSNPTSALLITTLIVMSGFWVLAAPAFSEVSLSTLAISAFVADGVLATAVANLLFFKSIERVGAGVSMSVVGSQSLFAALLAIILLQEELTLLLLLGTISVVVGIAILSEGGRRHNWRKRDLLFPLAAAVLLGSASIFKKVGMSEIGSPIIGSAINSGAAFLVIMAYLALGRKKNELQMSRTSVKFFCLAGMFQLAMILSQFGAVWLGKVVAVAPLINTSPLFTLILSSLFLREVERITPRIVIGAVLIVAGATLVVL